MVQAINNNMKLRYILLLILSLVIALPSQAVLKEKDLGQTLSILRAELQHAHDDMGNQQKIITERSENLRTALIATMNRSNQNALMLYSQKPEYVFDLTYACHEATEQYREFKKSVQPFRQNVANSSVDVARYDSLINTLTTMPLLQLDERARIDRNVCLALAINIRRMVLENAQTLNEYKRFYDFSEGRLKHLNDYAQKRYADIQNSIFANGGDNYFHILMNLPSNIRQGHQTVEDKYANDSHVHSQWDSRVILFLFIIILFYGIVSIILNQLVVRLIISRLFRRKKLEQYRDAFFAKRKCIIMATTTVTFALILCVLRIVMNQNFLLMASDLLVEYSWLLSVILISILLRVETERTMRTFRIYAPLMLVGFIVITFRIILIPNALVNLIFPPIMLVCMLWQLNVIKRCGRDVQTSDRYYAWFSFIVCLASVVCSWIGFTLLSVQLLIWWIMLLTCILTITCIKDWYTGYSERHDIENRPITQTWFYYFFTKVLTPTLAVMSFLYSIYWAADVFNLNDMVWQIFNYKFIDSDDFAASIITVANVIIIWFVFRYINSLVCQFVRYQFEKHADKKIQQNASDYTSEDIIKEQNNVESRSMMLNNVLQVVVWGIWFIISLSVLHVSNTWLVVISGGLSTGVGFASKDILENIYYGISLMTGRIKIGDLVVCDDIRGRVSSISYTSTMIEATDGSIIAFQNSQLFTKNYKNLTRNHGMEAQILEVGVAYGTNIKEVKQILIDEISKLPCVETDEHEVVILLKEFADNCLTLKIIVWLNAMTSIIDSGVVMECIYDTLNAHNVEIPFPQRDVHIIPNA